jgi:PAS domain S-box-containing protein
MKAWQGGINSPSASAPSPVIDLSKTDIQAADKYHAITQFSPTMLCIVNQDLYCSYISKNWKHLTGFNEQELMGKGLLHQIEWNSMVKLRTIFKENSVPENIYLKFQLQHQDGSWHWHDLKVASCTSTGEYICALHNIQSDIDSQQTLYQTRMDMEVSYSKAQDMLARMNHELRTPLNAIIGFSEMMEMEVHGDIENEEYKHYLKNINESGHTLLERIEHIVNLSAPNKELTLSESPSFLKDILNISIQSLKIPYIERTAVVKIGHSSINVAMNADKLKLAHATAILLQLACNSEHKPDLIISQNLTPFKEPCITITDLADNPLHCNEDNQHEELQLAMDILAEHGAIIQQPNTNSLVITFPKERLIHSLSLQEVLFDLPIYASEYR